MELRSRFAIGLLLLMTLMLAAGGTMESEPMDAAAYVNRGLAYRSKGQLDQAISDFNKALEINPRYALAYNNRAIAYYFRKDYDKAWDDVYKAQGLGFQIDPRFLKDLREASGREK